MAVPSWGYENTSNPKRQGELTMRNAIFAMSTIWRGGRGVQFAAVCLALGFALAGAPAAVADDVDAEPATSGSPKGKMVLLILDGGLRYEGTIRNRKMHGEGKLTFPDGRIYEGGFANGQIEGEGTYTYPDGRSYVGEFRNGMRNGYGILEFPSGEIYEGHWRDDKKNGQGVVIWPDGEKYVGGFRDGKMDGKGTYTYSNGRVREGIWANGKPQRGAAPSTPR
jgi:hypothetical protein